MIHHEKNAPFRAGAALDIGTTTVQAQLIDLDTTEILDNFSALNDQRIFGADVISRISAARDGKINGLFSAINNQTENILKQFILKWKLGNIEKCSVSGNTTMLHLFCRADPSAMGSAPYTPSFLEERDFEGKEISLSAENIKLLPGISAFIGADITAGLAYIEIMSKEKNALFVDIGTNGEIAVWKENEKCLFCCSTAAGSCFEETEITCGLSAAAFIDAIAEMKSKSVIDETGALADEFILKGFPVTHLDEYSSNSESLSAANIHKEKKFISQKEIRRFQLAKSAIYSGIKTLCQTASIKLTEIGAAYIAGRLGTNLNLKNAALTGLLPAEIIEKASACGNTSLLGAARSLTDMSFPLRCREIIAHAETVELASNKYFAAAFTHNMYI